MSAYWLPTIQSLADTDLRPCAKKCRPQSAVTGWNRSWRVFSVHPCPGIASLPVGNAVTSESEDGETSDGGHIGSQTLSQRDLAQVQFILCP